MEQLFKRNINNPLLTPDMFAVKDQLKVIGSFNPGACLYKDKVVLLVRVAYASNKQDEDSISTIIYSEKNRQLESVSFNKKDLDSYEERVFFYNEKLFLTSLSVFYLVTIDKYGNLEISSGPVLYPENILEEYGIEDPRITKIKDTYFITYVGVSRHGQTVLLSSTKDFKSFKKHGSILPPNNKDVVIFPEKINGKYYILHRPSVEGVPAPEMWYAESKDLISWTKHKPFMQSKFKWEDGRIGAGPPPIKTEIGWLIFYHAATKNNIYSMGAVLVDLEDISKVLWRSKEPLIIPKTSYELTGYFSDVVFITGSVKDKNNILKLYYGAADSSTCEINCDLNILIKRITEDM